MQFIHQIQKDGKISKASLDEYKKIEAPTSDDRAKAKFLTVTTHYGKELKGIVQAVEEDFLILLEEIDNKTAVTLRFDAVAFYKVC